MIRSRVDCRCNLGDPEENHENSIYGCIGVVGGRCNRRYRGSRPPCREQGAGLCRHRDRHHGFGRVPERIRTRCPGQHKGVRRAPDRARHNIVALEGPSPGRASPSMSSTASKRFRPGAHRRITRPPGRSATNTRNSAPSPSRASRNRTLPRGRPCAMSPPRKRGSSYRRGCQSLRRKRPAILDARFRGHDRTRWGPPSALSIAGIRAGVLGVETPHQFSHGDLVKLSP